MQQRASILYQRHRVNRYIRIYDRSFLLTVYCIDDNFELCHRLFLKTCIIKTFMYKYRFEPTIKTLPCNCIKPNKKKNNNNVIHM